MKSAQYLTGRTRHRRIALLDRIGTWIRKTPAPAPVDPEMPCATDLVRLAATSSHLLEDIGFRPARQGWVHAQCRLHFDPGAETLGPDRTGPK